jgi:hypothetical protein
MEQPLEKYGDGYYRKDQDHPHQRSTSCHDRQHIFLLLTLEAAPVQRQTEQVACSEQD